MEYLTVLVIDPGARGHAITDAYERSPQVKKIIVSPGNPFIGYKRRKEVIVDPACDLKDAASICAIAEKYRPHIVDIAQDDAIATGAGDILRERGFAVFCPSLKAARIEWDKGWARAFMHRHNISAPAFRAFKSFSAGERYVRELYALHPDKTVWIKAAGLAGGKGALRATSLREALERVRAMRSFGDAGKNFVIEDPLNGREFSYTVIADGESYFSFKPSVDYKRALPFDQGEQTGGMGAVSPVGMITSAVATEIEGALVGNILEGLADAGMPYTGILYIGGMLERYEDNPSGYKVWCVECNARWGDPEAQAVLPGMQTDYAALVIAAMEGKLCDALLYEDDLCRVCIVGAVRGYPGDYSAVAGKEIYGLREAMEDPLIDVFGAGIAVVGKRFYAMPGRGRLFSIVARGADAKKARERALAAMGKIHIEGNNLHYRPDIGWEEMEHFSSRA